jgi:hypothetical protein
MRGRNPKKQPGNGSSGDRRMPPLGFRPDPRDRWVRLRQPLSYQAECATIALASDLKCALGLRHYCNLTGLSLVALKSFLDAVEDDMHDSTLTETILATGAELLAAALGTTSSEFCEWEDGFDVYNDAPRDRVMWHDLKHAQDALGISAEYLTVCNE